MAGTHHTVCTAAATQGKQGSVPVCVGKIRGSMVQASMYVFEDVDQVKVI